MIEWVRAFLANEEMCGMGHAQRKDDNNLGLGWLYYALARIQRCPTAVVVGSHRGFVPILIGKGLKDNTEGGQVLFLDPSLWDPFWTEPKRVEAHFHSFGASNVRHIQMTSQEFAQTAEYRSLSGVGLLFIDGHHTYEQARFDYELFESKLAPDGIVLLHDSMMLSAETYGGIQDLHMTGVTFFVDELQQRPDLEVFDFPRLRTPSIFCTGLTIVRRKTFEAGNVYRNPAVPEYQSLQTGINHFNRRDLPGAIECFSTVIDLQPKFSAAWLLKGTALVCAGAVDDGLYCLGRAEELGHGRAPALIAAIKRELSRC